jgi:hypothetical protein
MSVKGNRPFIIALTATGSLFGLWAAAALLGGLHRVDWQITELGRQYLLATGMGKPIHTIVDFYTHIKGIEYIICVAFFVAFPLFYRYVERSRDRTKTQVLSDSLSSK